MVSVPSWLRHLDTAPLAWVAAVVLLASVAASFVLGFGRGSAGTELLVPAALAAAVVGLWLLDGRR